MTRVTRRRFLATAAALGAAPLWAGKKRKISPAATSHERRDLYPEGVASGDPQPDSVLLWTRRPYENGTGGRLLVEVAEDAFLVRHLSHGAMVRVIPGGVLVRMATAALRRTDVVSGC